MKAYPVEFREKVVKAYEKGDTSIRKLASRFDVSKSFVERLLRRNQATGDIKPLRQGGHQKSELHGYAKEIQEKVLHVYMYHTFCEMVLGLSGSHVFNFDRTPLEKYRNSEPSRR